MEIAFLDESGAPSPRDDSDCFVVAILVTAYSRAIELHVRRARRSLHRQAPLSELKAAQSEPRTIQRLLEAIADEECEIFAVIVEKRGMREDQAEAVYQSAVARTIALAAEQHQRLHVHVDKRYTKLRQRISLEQRIREALAHIPNQAVVIEQSDSTAQAGLQASDFVAWALRRQCEGDEKWAAIIARKVRVVEKIRGNKIAALPGGR